MRWYVAFLSIAMMVSIIKYATIGDALTEAENIAMTLSTWGLAWVMADHLTGVK